MAPKVFIDGQSGTTGLRIRDWLAERTDLEVLRIPHAERRDPDVRKAHAAEADVVVLCLPDAAAREIMSLTPPDKRVLDASSAHRVAPGWVYGLPELAPGQREAIARATRVSNSGCWATAIILATRPLVDAGLVPPDAPLAVHGISGYSGGGRDLIERWEDPDRGLLTLPYPAPYALERVHKHMPEIQRYTGLANAPQFLPTVGPFRCGMRVSIPLHAALCTRGTTPKAIWDALYARYRDERFVRVAPFADPIEIDERSFNPLRMNDTNLLEITVAPHPAGHALLVCVLDNLGKGASGVAIQNLNLMLGLEEGSGIPAQPA